MCGRFTLTFDPAQLEDMFPWVTIAQQITPRYNISPSQPIAVIPNIGDFRLDLFQWGLIPSWAKDSTIGNRLINARAETLSDKPSFRSALKKRRCLILADGFYEWMSSSEEKSKIPYYIHLSSGGVFAFAGLWDIWTAPDGAKIKSCTIITTQPNSLIAPIHNRMPVIVHQEAYSQWIEPGEVNPTNINELLAPYPANLMEAYPVSRAVNDPKHDSPSLIARV
jgi:putative SOS response-associated peptidase YedK